MQTCAHTDTNLPNLYSSFGVQGTPYMSVPALCVKHLFVFLWIPLDHKLRMIRMVYSLSTTFSSSLALCIVQFWNILKEWINFLILKDSSVFSFFFFLMKWILKITDVKQVKLTKEDCLFWNASIHLRYRTVL